MYIYSTFVENNGSCGINLYKLIIDLFIFWCYNVLCCWMMLIFVAVGNQFAGQNNKTKHAKQSKINNSDSTAKKNDGSARFMR